MPISYADWLTPDRVVAEDSHWRDSPHEKFNADTVARLLTARPTVLEVGCGTGVVASHLPASVEYLGVDANRHCLAVAWERNPGKWFMNLTVAEFLALPRNRHPDCLFDIVCAFAFFKHLELSKWSETVTGLLRLGHRAVFSQPIAAEDRDDGCEFFHCWVSPATIEATVAAAGHRIAEIVTGDDLDLHRWINCEAIIVTEAAK